MGRGWAMTAAAEPGARRAFLVPGALTGPSGGSRYNDRLLSGLRAAGLAVSEDRVPGAWPRPAAEDRRALETALRRYDDVVVDGLIASAAPEEIARARAQGVRVTALVHLPLPAERGLDGAPAGASDGGPDDALAAMERRALREVDAVIATSAWARRDLERRYGLDGIQVAAPGTDAAPVAAGSTPPRLLFLGSLTPRKNVLTLVHALTALKDRSWSAAIVGPVPDDGAYAAAVRDAARPAGGAIRILGAREGAALEALWEQTDLLVLPSLAETYGMVVTEALAHGIPAMVAAGTGAVEALTGSGERDGLPVPGIALDPHDVQPWTRGLAAWLDDPALRARWRGAALEHRSRLRAWETVAEEVMTAMRW